MVQSRRLLAGPEQRQLRRVPVRHIGPEGLDVGGCDPLESGRRGSRDPAEQRLYPLVDYDLQSHPGFASFLTHVEQPLLRLEQEHVLRIMMHSLGKTTEPIEEQSRS